MPKQQPRNPIQEAVKTWLLARQAPAGEDSEAWKEMLCASAPKRFTIYEPMALLPSGSFTKAAWIALLEDCDSESHTELWTLLLCELSSVAKIPLTHLAINEGIPLQSDGNAGGENVLRSPTGLRMMHGDFGPSNTAGLMPTPSEFDQALWVSTKQNGIHQTWAPRWTMFSRGNVKEKARLLEFQQPKPAAGGRRGDNQTWAVDLYAGIGYFVFSYAALGMRVLCWEINPWSVEGLRRGAEANRWRVKIVSGEAELARPVEEVVVAAAAAASAEESGAQIIVFVEDNQRARDKILRLQELGIAETIAHVNAGFLPTSKPTWEAAWEMARGSDAAQSWLHLHENVGVRDIERRREEMEQRFRRWNEARGSSREVAISHVEQVKTFAPGVWHCVFDVCITWPDIR